MRPPFSFVLLALSLLVAGTATARASTLRLDFASPYYLGWAVESIDSPASETALITFLGTLAPGASGAIADHNQTETAYRSGITFSSFVPSAQFVGREENSHDVYDTFSISGLGFVVAKFGAGLKDPRTITGYTSGRNPRPQYATSTHVWYLDVAGTDLVEATVPTALRGLSHVSFFSSAPTSFSANSNPPASVPDGGLTLLLLGGALGLLYFLRGRLVWTRVSAPGHRSSGAGDRGILPAPAATPAQPRQ
jgi:hypothetical protein